MGEPLVWSLADTHCVWCGKPVATDEDDERHSEAWEDQDKDCDRTTCWCTSYCWRNLGSCDTGDFIETEKLAELRGLMEAQAAVIARFRRSRMVCCSGTSRNATTPVACTRGGAPSRVIAASAEPPCGMASRNAPRRVRE